VLAFEFEMGLFPAALDEAKQKGIDLAPKTIPPEVFDKRAVEKGQVRFHDISYIEATPRFGKSAVVRRSPDRAPDSTEGLLQSGAVRRPAPNRRHAKQGVITRDVLTKKWTDWVDYWAVDFDYQSRKEIIKVPKAMGVENALPGVVLAGQEFVEFEERWTGSFIFENEWQSFRTRKDRDLEMTSAPHTYPKPGRYTIAVKVIDIFGNDTMTLVPVTVD